MAPGGGHCRVRRLCTVGEHDRCQEQRAIYRENRPAFERLSEESDRGRERGLAVELVRDWERYLNIKYAKQLGSRPLTVYVMPATRDQLLPFLADGLADLIVGRGEARRAIDGDCVVVEENDETAER